MNYLLLCRLDQSGISRRKIVKKSCELFPNWLDQKRSIGQWSSLYLSIRCNYPKIRDRWLMVSLWLVVSFIEKNLQDLSNGLFWEKCRIVLAFQLIFIFYRLAIEIDKTWRRNVTIWYKVLLLFFWTIRHIAIFYFFFSNEKHSSHTWLVDLYILALVSMFWILSSKNDLC